MRRNIYSFTETTVNNPGAIAVDSEGTNTNAIRIRTRGASMLSGIVMSDAELIGMAYDILNTLQPPTPVVDDDVKPKAKK